MAKINKKTSVNEYINTMKKSDFYIIMMIVD